MLDLDEAKLIVRNTLMRVSDVFDEDTPLTVTLESAGLDSRAGLEDFITSLLAHPGVRVPARRRRDFSRELSIISLDWSVEGVARVLAASPLTGKGNTPEDD